jgi:RimJ/RimL family protein N-acetyltransferase
MNKLITVNKNYSTLINKCTEHCSNNYFDNLILLGDLHFPCIKLSDIYAIIDNNEKISTVFTIFNGFENPSVIIDANCSFANLGIIFEFLKEKISNPFALISFSVTKEVIDRNFKIIDISKEIYMRTEKKHFIYSINSTNKVKVKRSTNHNYAQIEDFYKNINAYPWNPIQLESNFYHYIEINNKIIASGGTHFETPILAHLGNIHVNSEFRRRYYGEILVSTIVKNVLNEKQHATLFVQRDNSAAINLYKKLGFQVYKNVDLYICKNR